jgi:thiol-disulfide isomerase/thioredoxin
MKKTTLLFLLFPLFALAQNNSGIQFQNLSWSQLLAKAKTENKLIFVDAFTTWCGPCKQMSAEVFPAKSVGIFFNANFINAKIDMEKGEGLTIAEKYQVEAYPTYLFVNGDGKIVHKAIGYYEVADFISIGKDAKDPAKQFYTLKEKYDNGSRQPELLYNLVIAASELDDKDAGKIGKDYFKTQKNLLTKDNLELMLRLTDSPLDEHYNFLANNETEAGKILGDTEVKMAIDNIVLRYAISKQDENAPVSKQIESVETIAKKYRPASAKNLAQAYGLYLSLQTEDFAAYEKIALEYTDRNISELSAMQLNDIAWNFFLNVDNKSSLRKALVWILESIKKDSNSYNNDTAANLYNKLGDKKNAKVYAEKAISLGKAAGDDVSETEELLKTLKQ